MNSILTAAGTFHFATSKRSRVGLSAILGLIGAASTPACLNRPIEGIEPETYNVSVSQYKTAKVEKIDVLFMIDNSLSMADKQKVMAAAVPQLLHRLTSPDCINPNNPSAAPVPMAEPTAPCADPGYEREFDPVSDIHIGIITSSLGDHGGDICDDNSRNADGSLNLTLAHLRGRDDKAQLLGSLPRADTLKSPFLSWTPDDAKNYGSRIGAKETEFRNFVTAAGEHGCGLEMNLESWYRFLIDPEPPASVEAVTFENGTSTVRSKEVNQDILTQRKQFLRPDSLVAIVMLTDENDCSLKDSGASFLLGKTRQVENEGSVNERSVPYHLKGGSAACKNSPNDPCCYSCHFQQAPAGCTPDPNCAKPPNPTEDQTNLRCFNEKERYGYDFLFPTSRYVNALRLKNICPYQNYGSLDCDCTDEIKRGIKDCVAGPSFKNPLFDPAYSGATVEGEPRMKSDMVFLTGIVGVPWQDIAETGMEGPDAELRYKLASKIDWSLLLPSADGSPPRDPLMREQIQPRAGTHPVTLEPIGLPTSPSQRQLNSINWHDWNGKGEELQFACVFDITQKLSETDPGTLRDCSIPCAKEDLKCQEAMRGCPCTGTAVPNQPDAPLTYPNTPLCQAPDGTYGKIQYAAKAYPGTRQLEVLRGHNETAKDNSVVASICPKDLNWEHRNARGYGYNPAVQALVDRLKTKLTSACLTRELVANDGELPCKVMEAIPSGSEWAQCTAKGREEVAPSLADAVRNGMRQDSLCDVEGQPACSTYTICKLNELKDDVTDPSKPLTQCQNTRGYEEAAPRPGYCYIDAGKKIGNASLVKSCPTGRMIRIVGDGDQRRAPAPGSWTFIACAGAAFEKTAQ